MLQYKWLPIHSKGSYMWSSPGFHSRATIVHHIYMNNLPAYGQNANITMYADDTSPDKAIRTSQQLKEELILAFSKVYKCLETNKLSLNAVKTEFMIMGTSQRLNQLDKIQNPLHISL